MSMESCPFEMNQPTISGNTWKHRVKSFIDPDLKDLANNVVDAYHHLRTAPFAKDHLMREMNFGGWSDLQPSYLADQ